MYGCQQNLVTNKEVIPFLDFLCTQANKLINCGLYLARQLYFKADYLVKKYDLEKELKNHSIFKYLHSQAAQQTLRGVAESFQSYKKLRKIWWEGKLEQKPRLPNYRKKGGLAVITYPKQALRLKGNKILIPLGRKVKAAFGFANFRVNLPANLKFEQVKELRILPRNRCFYLEFVYELESEQVDLKPERVLGIDHGLDNWLTCISNVGTGFIINGKKLKSYNHWYHKQIATIKENKPQGFWSKKLASITEKRNRQMKDAVNKGARIIINHCLENQIGTIIFGWNQGQKNGINIGKKNNQKFVQIPTAKLKNRIEQLSVHYGIQFRETEESYTSQASSLDEDEIPIFGEKPEGCEFSGKRIKRGLYRCSNNQLINADANGSLNIIRKVNQKSKHKIKFRLDGVCMGNLTCPQRIKIWSAKKYEATAFQPVA